MVKKSQVKLNELADVAIPELEALFAFLETANFLIFRDVFPALEAYSLAKVFQAYYNELFDMVSDPEFGADPFIIEQWKRFFEIAQTKNWARDWVNELSSGSDIQRHSFALIINEQNQIEDRLVNDKKNTYLCKFGIKIGPQRIIEIANQLGLPRLCFPVAISKANSKPKHLLIYVVRDFKNLDYRIQTGRDIFVGLFGKKERKRLIETWVIGQPSHNGTRRDYNTDD